MFKSSTNVFEHCISGTNVFKGQKNGTIFCSVVIIKDVLSYGLLIILGYYTNNIIKQSCEVGGDFKSKVYAISETLFSKLNSNFFASLMNSFLCDQLKSTLGEIEGVKKVLR